jgi:hypothetical protein
MQNYNLVLWVSSALLLVALAVWGNQRRLARRARAERERRAAERQELGGDSYFLPPPPIEPAIEVSDPVEIDSLLDGEPDSVAAAARRQLEETTDLGMSGGLYELSLELGAAPPPPTLQERISAPAVASAVAPPAARPAPPDPGAPLGVPDPKAVGLPSVPARELVLAWYEARGYRATAADPSMRPIELVLRHRGEPQRAYAFVVERGEITGARLTIMSSQARAAGIARVLVAAEGGCDALLAKRARSAGVRIFDEAGILSQLAKVDIRIAAKIIAVARSRSAGRRPPVPATLAERAQEQSEFLESLTPART